MNALSPVSLQGDSRWTIPTALRLIHSHSADLHNFEPEVAKSGFYLIECVGQDYARLYPVQSLDQCAAGRLYAFNPVAVPVLAAPFVAGYELVTRLASPILKPIAARVGSPPIRALLQGNAADSTRILEILISSLFTAASVTVLYLAALELLPAFYALVVALTFAFGTLMWSLVSRALWQHSPSVFVNSLLVLLLIRGKYERKQCFAFGFLLALAFFVRPTNAVVVLVIGGYLLWHANKKIIWVIAGGIIPTVCFVWMNLVMYGSVLAPFFLPVRTNSTSLSLHSEVGLALISNLFSPARGLFVFMPFFLFLFVPGIWRQQMPEMFFRLRPWFCAVVGLQMLLVATHTDWWGGFSYGPRYLTDVLPYLMILWSPVLLWVNRNRLRGARLGVTLMAAFLIQLRGVTSIKVHEWNSTPVSVNENTRRIWDWSDPPFLR